MNNRNILIAGSSGFYGGILYRYLADVGLNVYGVDLLKSPFIPDGMQFQGDLRSLELYDKLFPKVSFDVIINLATQLDFASKNPTELYKNNVEVAKNLADFGAVRSINLYIFTSSNSIFLGNNTSYILQNDLPVPIDAYGKSKYDSEKILEKYKNKFNIVSFRCPNIIDSGRVGMLSILFELLRNNATLWMLGNGHIRHQCIYAGDLNLAIYKSIIKNKSYIFNIGSERVDSFKDTYLSLVKQTNSLSKVRRIPRWLAINLLKIFYLVGLSPMGPYQFRMLTRNFEFDINYVKNELEWRSTLNLSQILSIAYFEYLNKHRACNEDLKSASASPIKMGVLALLKYIKI